MNILIYVFLLAFLFFIIFIVLFLLFVLDSLLRNHDLPTSKQAIKALIDIIYQYNPDADKFYDLGCGRGDVVLGVKKGLPSFAVYGIDYNVIRIFFSRLKSKFLRRTINFKKQDIFQTDLRDVDIIYTYLWYDLMPILEKKLQEELKQGAIVITNTSRFLRWKPVKTYIVHPEKPDFEKLFVYIKE